jgi:hypothetical protein
VAGDAPEQVFVIGSMQIDVAGARVAPRASVHAVFEAVEREDTGEDEVIVPRLAAPSLTGPLPRHEHRALRRIFADLLADLMPARRRAE